MNINEILYQCRLNNEKAFEELVNIFLPMIKGVYNDFNRKGKYIEFDEAMQCARIGIINAVDYYRDDKNMAFYNFARICILREMNKGLHNQNSIKTCKYIKYISLDTPLTESESLYLVDTISSETYGDTEKNAYLNIMLNEIEKKLGKDSNEYAVFRLRIKGYSYKEIAKILNINVKRVDYLLTKIRKKLSYIKEDDK